MPVNSSCWVVRDGGQALRATIIRERPSEYYVHYDGRDKRLDEWVPANIVQLAQDSNQTQNPNQEGTRAKKRNRTTGPSLAHSDGTPVTADELPHPSLHTRDQTEAAQQHSALTAQRNFDRVAFGQWSIKTWYFSPYPNFDDEIDSQTRPRATSEGPANAAHGASGAHNSHSHPSLLTTAPANHNTTTAASTGSSDATLWVCDRCFKYMREATHWELHKRACRVRHPPGRKVYQRGAHTIWEVDGQTERLYCQNLSLFGKLFIDVKTLFFDTEHFMFYILTDADAQRDHVLAYFSQEKVSYDDYNLACIVTLPPYQKHGYGMLLIEFSYELSRRGGKLGTPERPLSDLGLRSYVSFWIAVLVRFFRTITPLDEHPNSGSADTSVDTRSNHPTISEESSVPLSSNDTVVDQEPERYHRQASTSEHILHPVHTASLVNTFGEISYHTGGAGHQFRTVRCGLEDIAHATHLRPDDIALALREAGLLVRRRSSHPISDDSVPPSDTARNTAPEAVLNGVHDGKSGYRDEMQIVITREMIEAVARERKIKPAYLDRAYVLL